MGAHPTLGMLTEAARGAFVPVLAFRTGIAPAREEILQPSYMRPAEQAGNAPAIKQYAVVRVFSLVNTLAQARNLARFCAKPV